MVEDSKDKEVDNKNVEGNSKVENTPETLTNDPFAEENWKAIFPELYEKKEDGLTKEEVVKIVREQILKWLKGVESGKYPLPKNFYPQPSEYPYPSKYPYPTEYPYPSKEKVEGLEKRLEEVEGIAKNTKTKQEEIETLEKSVEDMKKEIEKIRDSPLESLEKSLEKGDKDKEYKSPFEIKEDGSITIIK